MPRKLKIQTPIQFKDVFSLEVNYCRAYDHQTYDEFYLEVFDDRAALKWFEKAGFLYPANTTQSSVKQKRKELFEQWRYKKLKECPDHIKMFFYFLIAEGLGQAVI